MKFITGLLLLFYACSFGQEKTEKDTLIVGKTIVETVELAKTAIAQNHYEAAQVNIEKYFSLQPDKTSATYQELLVNLVKVKQQLAKEEAGVPFLLVEKAPIYPGCEAVEGRRGLMNCMQKGIRSHVLRRFKQRFIDALELEKGNHTIYINFKFNRSGKVTDVRIRAPHPELEKKMRQIMISMPKVIPAKINGRPVGVKYTLPLRFSVDGKRKKRKK